MQKNVVGASEEFYFGCSIRAHLREQTHDFL